MKTMARYLIHGMTYCKILPTDESPRTLGEQATRARPVVIELHPDIPPSRSWLALNAEARDALAAIGVDAAIVKAPAAAPERHEADTNSEIAATRNRVVGRDAARASDVDPITGKVASPEPSRLAK